MPLYTNIGGKLTEIKSLNTTTGDILKPIYGTPKENTTLHWGGFSGQSGIVEDDILLGEFTVSGGMLYNPIIKPTDTIAPTKYTSITSDDLPTIPPPSDTQIKILPPGIYMVKYCVCNIFKTKSTKTVKYDTYKHKYTLTYSRIFEIQSDGTWKMTRDDFSNYNRGSDNFSVNAYDEGTYYLYGAIRTYISYTYKLYYKSNPDELNERDITIYLPFDGLSFDITNKFQTVNG